MAEENPYNEKLISAYAVMAFASNKNEKRYKLTPEEYEQTRITFSNSLKKKYQNKENHPSYGTHISEERKRKIGEVNKGNKYCVGRKITDETKKKIGNANRNPCEETRRKMSESQKIRQAGANNSNAKRVIRLSDGKIYECGKDAALDNNIKYPTFKGKVQKCKGFMYYNEWLMQNNNLENNIC